MDNVPAETADSADPIGEIMEGVVIEAGPAHAVLDIDSDLPGHVLAEDLRWSGHGDATPGDRLAVLVTGLVVGGEAYRCSAAEADALSVWDAVRSLADSGDIVPCRVVAEVRGGASVDLLGTRGFLPSSQVDLAPVDDLSDIVGETIAVRVVDLDDRKGQPVVSRRAILEEEAIDRARDILETLREGERVRGKVVRLANFGAFLDIGGVDALLRTAEMSWGRVRTPADFCAVGDEVEAILIRVDSDQGKAAVSVKALAPDPWLSVEERYRPGTTVTGAVVRTTRFGAFIELEPGIDGLIHATELQWGGPRNVRPSDVVAVGDEVEAVVVEVDGQRRRIGLSRRRALPDPLVAFAEAHPVGSVLDGVVRNTTDFGVFLEVAEGVEGLCHRNDLSWTEPNASPAAYEAGATVQVKLLAVETESRRVALGVKQLGTDPFEAAAAGLQRGSTLKGKVVRIADFGAFVEVAEHVDGLVHVSELSTERVERVADVVSPGDELEVFVLGVDREKRQIRLSVKALTEPPEPEEERAPVPSVDGEARTSLGALLRESMEKKAPAPEAEAASEAEAAPGAEAEVEPGEAGT